MANTILERLQEKYPNAEGINDARNIAEAIAVITMTGGRGANAIVDSLYEDEYFTYDPNGGEGERFREYHFKDAASVTFPECPFTPPEGKVFQDWYIIDEEHQTEDHIGPGARDYAGIGNKTVYASWTDLLTVSFNTNGGEGEIDDILVPDGQSIETLPDGTGLTAPEGKVFGGWATTDSALVADVTAPYTPADDTILYAFWVSK